MMMKIKPTPTLNPICAFLSANLVLGKNSSSKIIGIYTAFGKLAMQNAASISAPRFQSISLSGRDISVINSEHPNSENAMTVGSYA